ncbi:MAG: BMP family ABC transporter substrate-binding protein, partial [Acidimicrobiia bacterium]|nr:BMP family ABC transporter substrate-binding protein [Acidimicrobiia bacterium]
DADVVYHAAGRSGFGVFQAAREHTEATSIKHWGIGSDSDQILEVGALEQDYVLFSVLRKYDVVASSTVHDLLNGDLDAGTVRYTLADGGLGYSTRGNHLSDLAVSRIAQAEASNIDGTVAIPLIPVGDVLPPLEASVPVGTVEVRYDGSQCSHRYSGPNVVNSGQSVRIVVVNDGAVMSWAGAFLGGFGGAAASMVAADPGRTQVGYFVATDSRYGLGCGYESVFTELMTIEVE